MQRIVVVTDCKDVAFNEIRATILKNLGSLGKDFVIEPMVSAEEFSLVNGAFLVRLMAEVYEPKETVFLVILNSLKTTHKDRARIIGETNNGFKFVGANTGTLNWLIKDFGLKKLYELKREGLTGEKFISFGGKYFHAPAVAKIVQGIPFSEIGEERTKKFLTKFEVIEGQVVHIDNFGVPKINKILKGLREGESIMVFSGEEQICEAVYTHSMKDLNDGTLAIYPGSSLGNLIEIGFVREKNTAERLGIKIGDLLRFERVGKNDA